MIASGYEVNAFMSIPVLDVRETVGKIKSSMSFGSDNVSCYFLKFALLYIENALLFMFNTSLETGLFPETWKIARITPIFKDGDRSCKANHHPIYVVPVIARLFEMLVFNQLYRYLNGGGFLYQGQSAYRKLHSTIACLLKNTEY